MRPLRRLAAVATIALALLVSGGLATVALAQPSDDPAATEATIRAAVVPGRDPEDLARRFRRLDMPAAALSMPQATDPIAVGQAVSFWVVGPGEPGYREAVASLRYVGEHAAWYVEEGQRVDQWQLERVAASFDERIYPLVRRAFGTEPLPGLDGEARLTILLAGLPGMAAYYSSADAVPRHFHPYSNEREMLYLEAALLESGHAVASAVLAHELQHLVGGTSNPHQETWVNEGAAELAASLIGYQPDSFEAFELQPDTPLTAWSADLGRSPAHYQAAYLFMRYLLERYLVQDDLLALLGERVRGQETFNHWLRQHQPGTSFDDIFKDWAIASYLDEMFPQGGRFGYGTLDIRARAVASLGLASGQYAGQVQQYGTDFLELVGDEGDVEVVFQGTPAVSLVGTATTSGESFWWSNRGDSADMRLTRAFDLSGLTSAHLHARLWYDTEAGYDYGYLLVSRDGGQTWQSLCTSEASEADPTGNNLGCGFSGVSGGAQGPLWLEEVVDLSPYASQPVLVRFEYVTDQAYNARGFLVDDIAVPELGFWDDAETERGWQAEGFVRVSSELAQQYSVRLLLFRGSAVDVVDVPLDGSRRGVARVEGLGSQVSRAVVAISALAPQTLEPAPYTIDLQAKP